jgi:hypothetical protein
LSASSQQSIHPCKHAIFPGFYLLLIKQGVNWFNTLRTRHTQTRQATNKTKHTSRRLSQDKDIFFRCGCIRNSALFFWIAKLNKARRIWTQSHNQKRDVLLFELTPNYRRRSDFTQLTVTPKWRMIACPTD